MKFELIPAVLDQQPVIANLLELYAHDFSEFFDIELGEDGRYGYPHLPLYWTEDGRYPFLIKVDGSLAGFALVKSGWDMAEFFIVRRYRRHGLGTLAAHEIWRTFPGAWEVRVMESNVAAREFWGRAIAKFAGRPVAPLRLEQHGRPRFVYKFDSA